jgi:ACDE family multidrug resistance protein
LNETENSLQKRPARKDFLKSPKALRMYFTLVFLGFAYTIVHSSYVATVPLYIQDHNQNSSTVGFVAAALAFGSIAFRIIFAGFVDRMPEKPLLLFANVLLLISSALMLSTPANISLMLPRLAQGLAMATFFTIAFAWIGRNSNVGNRGRLFGIFGFVTAVAMMAAPPASLWLYDRMGMIALVWANLIVCGAAAIATIRWTTGARPGEGAEVALPPAAQCSSTGNGRLDWHAIALVCGCITLSAAILGVAQTFMPYIAQAKQYPFLGVLLATFGLGLAAARFIAGSLTDKLGRAPVAIAGAAMLAGTNLGFWWIDPPIFMPFLSLAFGIGMGTLNASLMAWLADLAEGPNQGSILSYSAVISDVGIAMTVVAIGYLAAGDGLRVVASSSLLALAALTLTLIAARKIRVTF